MQEHILMEWGSGKSPAPPFLQIPVRSSSEYLLKWRTWSYSLYLQVSFIVSLTVGASEQAVLTTTLKAMFNFCKKIKIKKSVHLQFFGIESCSTLHLRSVLYIQGTGSINSFAQQRMYASGFVSPNSSQRTEIWWTELDVDGTRLMQELQQRVSIWKLTNKRKKFVQPYHFHFSFSAFKPRKGENGSIANTH